MEDHSEIQRTNIFGQVVLVLYQFCSTVQLRFRPARVSVVRE